MTLPSLASSLASSSQVPDLARVVLIGIGATALMDAWLIASARLGLPATGFALLGRWVGHLVRGRVVHAAIARSAPVAGERLLGWIAHYLVGIAFAGLLVGAAGRAWLQRPSLLPALAFGVASVAAPLFVMQPAMGAGIAASRTATPLRNVLRSTLNHAVFGIGLYVAAASLAAIVR